MESIWLACRNAFMGGSIGILADMAGYGPWDGWQFWAIMVGYTAIFFTLDFLSERTGE